MATVTTSIPVDEQAAIVEAIDAICHHEPQLTPRSKQALVLAIHRGDLAIAKDDKDALIGWLIAESICPGVQELGMAYIMPEWRQTGVRNLLLEALIDDSQDNMAITYNSRIARDLVAAYNFEISTLRVLCTRSRGRILIKRLSSLRSVYAVLRHASQQQPIYLIRKMRK